MRLLQTRTLRLEEFTDANTPPFAILSHVWGSEEVSRQDIQESRAEGKRGFAKIFDCCKTAISDGFEYAWIDSCCIDKTSSAELSEAINSMYTWYQRADVCYAYLEDVILKAKITASKWFTRGWTLQELIAPSSVIFLNRDWRVLGDKATLCEVLSSHTGIPRDVLSSNADLSKYSVAQKMSWAACRTTTRIEDRAYSLLGIFGINLSPIYGEQETSFIRLQEEIIRTTDDQSLFAWSSDDDRGGLLATSPDAFKSSGNIVPYTDNSRAAPYMSSRGVHLELFFMGLAEGRRVGLVVLECQDQSKRDEEESIAIYVHDVDLMMQRFQRVRSSMDTRISISNLVWARGSVRKICVQRARALSTRMPAMLGGASPYQTLSQYSPEDLITEGPNSLRHAVLTGAIEDVWYQLTLPNIESWLQSKDGYTIIYDATHRGEEELLRVLLARSGIKAHDVDETEGKYPSLVATAVQHRHYCITKLLLEKGFSPDPPFFLFKNVTSPLSNASKYGEEAIAKLLIKYGADVNWLNGQDRTPLSFAAEKGHNAIVQLLLQESSYWTPPRCQMSPLLFAAKGGYEAIVRLIVQNDPNSRFDVDVNGRTALSYAHEHGHGRIVRILAGHNTELPILGLNSRALAVRGFQADSERIAETQGAGEANVDSRNQATGFPLIYLNWH